MQRKDRKERLIRELRKLDELVLREPVVLSSGIESDYKIDFEQAEGAINVRDLVAQLLLEEIPSDVSCVVAEGGAKWLAELLTDKYSFLTATYVDDLDSGRVSGHPLRVGEKCCVIEDVVTTGRTMSRVGKCIEEKHQGSVSKYIAVVKRPEQDILVPEGSRFAYLIDATALLGD